MFIVIINLGLKSSNQMDLRSAAPELKIDFDLEVEGHKDFSKRAHSFVSSLELGNSFALLMSS